MDIRIKDKSLIEKFKEFKQIENIKCNTKAFKELLKVFEINIRLEKENEKLKQKKSLTT